MKIFVSYTTRDSVITIQNLQQLEVALSNIGQPYIDLIHNDSKDKQKRVEQELAKSQVVLLLKTSSILLSPWVQREINLAQNFGIPIKSINIHNKMPDTQKLAELFY